jgi:hypothetical protein
MKRPNRSLNAVSFKRPEGKPVEKNLFIQKLTVMELKIRTGVVMSIGVGLECRIPGVHLLDNFLLIDFINQGGNITQTVGVINATEVDRSLFAIARVKLPGDVEELGEIRVRR